MNLFSVLPTDLHMHWEMTQLTGGGREYHLTKITANSDIYNHKGFTGERLDLCLTPEESTQIILILNEAARRMAEILNFDPISPYFQEKS